MVTKAIIEMEKIEMYKMIIWNRHFSDLVVRGRVVVVVDVGNCIRKGKGMGGYWCLLVLKGLLIVFKFVIESLTMD